MPGLRSATGMGTCALWAALAAGCGGGGGGPAPAAVAAVEVTPAASSLLAGATVQLSATAKDGQGAALAGRPIAWSSSDAAVATVSAAGLVTTLAPGSAAITATSEGKSGAAAITSIDPVRMPVLQRPFPAAAAFQTSNFFDHDVPKEFVDANGRYVSYWGEDSLPGIDGHNGYDWRMETGTPVLAALGGSVVFAGASAPFTCPILGNATVSDQNLVTLEHALPGGVRLRTQYIHLDTVAVSAGQQVQAGQQLGTVGAKGCALNPHLHFSVIRLTQTASGQPAVIDPYGWSGPGTDPWQASSEGAQSIYLWKAGEEPPLFRRFDLPLNPNPGDNLFVAITQVRFQGVDDAHNPDNEYVEVTRDNRFAPASLDLGGFTLKNKAGQVFTFPAGFVLTAARTSARVFTGSGTATDTQLFWGQAEGRFDNRADCVQFLNAAGAIRNRVGWGGGCL